LSGQYRLPEELRSKLAKPLGRLFTRKEIESGLFAKTVEKSSMVISVGDRVTETLGGMGRVPDVQIVDSKENRKAREPPDVEHGPTIRVKNPAGYITADAIDGIRKAFGGRKPVMVLVEGEEDLLAIPAVALAPLSADVFYGQPGEGIVMVRADASAKARNRTLLAEMGAPAIR
jgi:uncharacterized protein (UPF0218 family)